jgi:2-polyprenyl-3-methyl-5-hydroxy-6-metoxy-1,4-benzoquinol methylase
VVVATADTGVKPDTGRQIMLMTDEEWWNQKLKLTERTWVLPPRISRLIRQEQLDSMFRFLFKQGGTLLDIGCGSGWLSIKFAQTGMQVTGLDVSRESLAKAQYNAVQASVTSYIKFMHVDLRNFSPQNLGQTFDSIVSYAVLFFLQDNLEDILLKLKSVLKDDGILYLYEPICYRPEERTACSLIYNLPFSLLKHLITKTQFMQEADLRDIINTSNSNPKENAFKPESLQKLLAGCFSIVKVEYWQMRSQAYAEMCATLKKSVQPIFTPFINPFYLVEKQLLKYRPFREKTNSWIMASYCCRNLHKT